MLKYDYNQFMMQNSKHNIWRLYKAFMLLSICSIMTACSQAIPASVEQRGELYHTKSGMMKIVKTEDGESLEVLAKKYKVPVAVIGALNNIEYPYYVQGEKYISVPMRDSSADTEEKNFMHRPIVKKELEPLEDSNSIAKDLTDNTDTSDPTLVPVTPIPQSSASSLNAPIKNKDVSSINPAINKNTELNKQLDDMFNEEGSADLPNKTDVNAKSSEKMNLSATSATTTAPMVKQAYQAFKYPTPLNLPNFKWPVDGKLTKSFDVRKDGFNEGILISAPMDSPVVAAADGQVMYANTDTKRFGNLVLMKHDQGYITAYAHNNRNLVKVGEHVKMGQQIATIGKTGQADSPQLYFSIKKGKQIVNPESNFLATK